MSKSLRRSQNVERIGFLSMTVAITILLSVLLVLSFSYGILAVMAVAGALFVSIVGVLFALHRFEFSDGFKYLDDK